MKTIKEMQEYIMKETDHKVINELLASGMEWDKAVELAYMSTVK